MGVKFGTEEGTLGPLLRAKFHPHRCNVWPLRGENPQNRPLSKLNNRHFALRAMLPVNKHVTAVDRNRTCAKAEDRHKSLACVRLQHLTAVAHLRWP